MNSFVVINESFICLNCGEINPKLKGSCRNHCRKCLYSLHVDENSPGDRKSACFGLMEPVSIDHSGKKGWIVLHKCQKCGKMMKNKEAPDDNFDRIIELTKINEHSGKQKT